MALTAQQIIDRAKRTLNDPDSIQWPETELLEYLSDGQRAAVQYRPEIYAVTEAVPLVTGTKQELPDDAFSLIDVIRNMGADGNTPGRAISKVDKYYLDRWRKDWHSQAGSAEVRNFVYDVRNRRTFYVIPPQPAVPHRVEIIYSKIPPELTNLNDAITLDDIYQPALLAYILHRAFVKDISAEGQGEQKSKAYFEQFMIAIGARDEAEMRLHPTQQQQVARNERGY